MNWIKRKWSQIETPAHIVRDFGLILTGVFFLAPFVLPAREWFSETAQIWYWIAWPLVSLVWFVSHIQMDYWLGWSVFGCLTLIITLWAAPVMRFIFRSAMFVAAGISWAMTRIVLFVMFYGVFTPIGVAMRLLGKDLLETKIDKEQSTYWVKRSPRPDRQRYERLF